MTENTPVCFNEKESAVELQLRLLKQENLRLRLLGIVGLSVALLSLFLGLAHQPMQHVQAASAKDGILRVRV